MHLSDLKNLHVTELVDMAITNEIDGANRLRKQDLIFALLKNQARKGESIFGEGTLEVLQDGFGFLRSPDTSYLAGPDDIYVSPSQIRRFNLHTGDSIDGEIRTPKDGERYFALVKVDKVNSEPPENSKHKILFENLTPLFPTKRLQLERDIKADENITGRIIDLIAPIGKGQRGLLVASPKSGKTVMLQNIAHAIAANHPETILMVLLIDERPEEVTEMIRSVRGEVISSTFAGGYAAGYYSYKWAEVLSADAYSLFEEEGLSGITNTQTGARFRNEILAVGGSRPALESFIAFRGREPKIDALLRHSGMADASA